MAVIIRLRRDGAKNSPYYRVVVADKHSPRDGKFLELIGTYDPKKKGDNSTVKIARAEHWMKLGARPSDTVKSILKKAKAKSAKEEKEAAAAKEEVTA
jgi:small subunit ribosomal protein S16